MTAPEARLIGVIREIVLDDVSNEVCRLRGIRRDGVRTHLFFSKTKKIFLERGCSHLGVFQPLPCLIDDGLSPLSFAKKREWMKLFLSQ